MGCGMQKLHHKFLKTILLHKCLQNYGGTHLIDQFLVAACVLFQTRIQHCLKREFGGVPLVDPNHWKSWKTVLKPVHKWTNVFHALRLGPIGLKGQTHHNLLNRLLLHILHQKVKQFRRGHSG